MKNDLLWGEDTEMKLEKATNVCEHGSLRRQCLICELNAEISELKKPLSSAKIIKQNVYVCSMGKLFKVLSVCRTDEQANVFCQKHSDTGVMAVDSNNLVYVCETYGRTIKSDIVKEFMSE